MPARSEPVDVRADRTVQGAVDRRRARRVRVPPALGDPGARGAPRRRRRCSGRPATCSTGSSRALVAPRLSPATGVVPPETVQAQDLLGGRAPRRRHAVQPDRPRRAGIDRDPRRGRRGGDRGHHRRALRRGRDRLDPPPEVASRIVSARRARRPRRRHPSRRRTAIVATASAPAGSPIASTASAGEHAVAHDRGRPVGASTLDTPKHMHGTCRACARTSTTVNAAISSERDDARHRAPPRDERHRDRELGGRQHRPDHRRVRAHRPGGPSARTASLGNATRDRSLAVADATSTAASTTRAASASDASFTRAWTGEPSALVPAVPAPVEEQRLALVLVAELDAPCRRR